MVALKNFILRPFLPKILKHPKKLIPSTYVLLPLCNNAVSSGSACKTNNAFLCHFIILLLSCVEKKLQNHFVRTCRKKPLKLSSFFVYLKYGRVSNIYLFNSLFSGWGRCVRRPPQPGVLGHQWQQDPGTARGCSCKTSDPQKIKGMINVFFEHPVHLLRGI